MHAASMPRGERILVIDDSLTVREELRERLEDAGFEVEATQDGPSALELLAPFQPDVVLCDMHMPQMSGVQVVGAIRQRAPLVPVLIITSSEELPLVVTAMREGAFGYLLKDTGMDELVAELRSALEHRRLLQRNRELEQANQEYQRNLERMVEEKTRQVAKLQETKAQNERLAAMGTLAAGIAHEINNPLAVVKSNIDWLLQAFKAAASRIGTAANESASFGSALGELSEAPDILGDTAQCADRIQRIVQRLRQLAFATAAHGRCEVRQACEEVKLVCGNRLPPGVGVTWEVDARLESVGLAQDDFVSVLSNLIVNAADALECRPPGNGRIGVRLVLDGGAVQATVEDNGCGIAPRALPRVCDPFFTTKPPGKGMGLGLSLVHELVRAAGGKMSIESEVGQGTVISVRLPIEPTLSAPDLPPPAPRPPS